MDKSVFDMEITAADYMSELYDKCYEICDSDARMMETPADFAMKEEKANIKKRALELLELGILDEEAVGEYYSLESEIHTKKDNIKKLYGIEVSDMSLKALAEAKKEYSEAHIVSVNKLSESSTEHMQELQENYDTNGKSGYV